MQALLFSGIGSQAEALESIKKTLFKNFSNFTCWHVYGIIYRKEKDYEQAKKAYLNALKYAPDNENVMRDLSARCSCTPEIMLASLKLVRSSC